MNNSPVEQSTPKTFALHRFLKKFVNPARKKPTTNSNEQQ
jgi:hypothetical protein